MPGRNLNLLSLDGGGVRGLSSLYILQRIMVSIDPDNPPKPCDYFDIIGGTSTGGLIAIMLGRLEMSIDECIKAYTDLSEDVFHKKRRIPTGIKGDLKERYDSGALELAVKKILKQRNLDENALFKSPGGTKVFVCCTSGETSEATLLRTWHTIRGDPDLYRTVRIWEAARATSAASTFFDSISIGVPGQRFLDEGTGVNNPVRHIWGEAADLLPRKETLLDNLGCLVSIGTGHPGYKPFEETVLGIGKALLAIATETETTANTFHREQSVLFENRTCFRFNVPRGLGDIGLAETEQLSAIKSMTSNYLQTEAVQGDLRSCVQQLGERQMQQPSTRSADMILQKVTQDEDEDFYALSQDSHWQLTNSEDNPRDLLERISSYQPQRVHCKISMQKTRDTTHWIVEDILSWVHDPSQDHDVFRRCLWISGIVGCGKTLLANTAVQTLLDLEDQGPVAHFYFDPDQHETLTTEALLRSYVKQFLRHLHATHLEPPRPIVNAIKRMFGSRTYQLGHTQIVEQLLKPLIHGFRGSCLVVDGLDLCSPQEYKVALDCFSRLLQETPVRIIICGRDELSVTRRFPGSMRLEVTRAKTKGDLALFIEQYIKERSMKDGPISNDGSTLARIRDTLTDQAKGMFLWARLQIDVLWDICTTDDQIDLVLSDLPKDLDETYERCLQRIEGNQQQYSLRILRYVCEATSPLTIDALGEALATDLDTGELDYSHIPRHTAILRYGANLIVFDEVERFVLPAHHSVRKFLQSSRAPISEARVSNAIWEASYRGRDEMMQSQLANQLDQSNDARSVPPDSGYESNQTWPMVDNRKCLDSQPLDEDVQSVGTVETDIQSSTESLALSNVREAAANEIARALIGDEEISKLYDEGLRRMDGLRFIENHRRLLKLFYLEAAKDAADASHYIVVRFLRSRIARIRVSARIVKAKDPLDEDSESEIDEGQSLRLIEGILTQADKRRDISRWTETQQSDLNEQSEFIPGSGDDRLSSLVNESFTSKLPMDNLDDDEDFEDLEDFDEASLRVDDLPALVKTTAFLMDGRAFQIYRNNLQRLAYGKRIAPTAFRYALVAGDLATAIELLENELEAVTQSRLGFEWIKEPLAMGFTPAEVVRLIIEIQEELSGMDGRDRAIGAGKWEEAQELIRGDQPRASYKVLITEHFIATARQASSSTERLVGLVSPLEHISEQRAYDIFPDMLWKEPFEYLKTRLARSKIYSSVPGSLEQRAMSRLRELMVWSGLILGPLKPGYTRITWKNNMGHRYTSDVKQLNAGGISKVFGNLERSRGIRVVSMGNTANTAGNSLWTTLSNKVVQWTSKKTRKPPILPQQTPTVISTGQPRQRISNVEDRDILMICMQRGKRSKTLYQEKLFDRRIDNDQALFVFLQQMFITHRGAFRSYLSLRTLKELKLVEFRLPKNKRPFIPYLSCPNNTCRCLPPQDKILPVGDEYRCTSSGGGGDICPPVPAHVLTDCYEDPGSVDITQTWLIELLPKRVCGELEGKSTEPAQGWGISYEEGWDHEKIGLVLLIVFFGGSLVFGLSWTVVRNDIQGAFGVAAWWLSASTILLGYVAIRADDA